MGRRPAYVLGIMPELPEVETVVRGLNAARLCDMPIAQVKVCRASVVAGMPPAAFARALTGRTVRGFRRRAKYILADLDDGRRLLIHLRMTGQFRIESGAATPADPHDRMVLVFADGRRLHFHDSRAFGRFRLVAAHEKPLAHLGPEPLDRAFTAKVLTERLRTHRRRIKPVLLDQTVVAGLGNIYVDESLWAAGIHPSRAANTLVPAEVKRLHAAIRRILPQAIRAGGTTLGRGATTFRTVGGGGGNHAQALQVFRRGGAPCPRCGHPLMRTVLAQRGTHFCPHCQPET